MKRKRRRELQKTKATPSADLEKHSEKSAEGRAWLAEQFRWLWLVGIILIALCIAIIYGQTVRVPPIGYEDPFYLVNSPYVHVNPAFSRLNAVWNEPYFANFHPVTTTTWLIDRALCAPAGIFCKVPMSSGELETSGRQRGVRWHTDRNLPTEIRLCAVAQRMQRFCAGRV